jgi:hypothetical protein
MIMADSQANPEVDLDNVIDRLLEGESFVIIYLVRMVQGDKEEQWYRETRRSRAYAHIQCWHASGDARMPRRWRVGRKLVMRYAYTKVLPAQSFS